MKYFYLLKVWKYKKGAQVKSTFLFTGKFTHWNDLEAKYFFSFAQEKQTGKQNDEVYHVFKQLHRTAQQTLLSTGKLECSGIQMKLKKKKLFLWERKNGQQNQNLLFFFVWQIEITKGKLNILFEDRRKENSK